MPKEFIFVDTSAFYALMDRSDRHHEKAKELWPLLLENPIRLMTSNYMVFDTVGLLQYKLGFGAALLWYRDILSVVDILWIGEADHLLAYELWVDLGRRRHSLVDCTSYVLMRRQGIEKAFCFKQGYSEHSFDVIPSPDRCTHGPKER